MKLLTTAPRGTKDVLPNESYKWQYIERTALDTAKNFGFSEIRTPTFEHTELFNRAVGDTTDVVQKEEYTFLDKGDRSITLRPEGTAGVIRACAENGLLNGQLPLKCSYVLSCFRYEKPQAGRLREFHQFGVEALGSDSPSQDAEIISLADTFLKKVGVKDVKLYINSIGCKECRPAYHEKLKAYFNNHLDCLCETCKNRLETNPLRILDCKNTECKEIAKGAPKIIDNLCPGCQDHFEKLKENLLVLDIPYEIDPDIVRGLDYYCRTVFEFVTETIGAQGTVCGGGRYDGLCAQIGGPNVSGIGFGLGLERLQIVMEKSGAIIPEEKPLQIYIATLGEASQKVAAKLVNDLRKEGIRAEFDTMNRSLKAQMRSANNQNAIYTLTIGDDEVASKKAKLKCMADGNEKIIDLDKDIIIKEVK